MDHALEHFTDDFIKYDINDVVLLRQIVKAKIELINWLTKDVLKIPLEFSRDTIPMTQGRLVSTIFESYLSNKKNLDLDVSPEIILKGDQKNFFSFFSIYFLKKFLNKKKINEKSFAVTRTRTGMDYCPQTPQACASTYFTITADYFYYKIKAKRSPIFSNQKQTLSFLKSLEKRIGKRGIRTLDDIAII